jgi:hypothetical protein
MNLLGRCEERDCNFALFAPVDRAQAASGWSDVTRIGVPYKMPQGFYAARCANGHKAFVMRPIEGTYSATHKCDSRCLNAKGHTCTCSCGGANHGMGYAIAVSAVGEGQHIGIVGKHIRGTATVVGKREGVGQYNNVLYVFLTESGAEIKWFCPPVHDPYFAQGQKVTFRAKVKAHPDDRYGKSTIVTYLERME